MSYQPPITKWFLAQSKPNSHAIAERNLIRQGFKTFLPMRDETERVRDRFVTRRRPLFPGYVFVALDLDAGSWRAVNSTIGVTRLVTLGKEPTPVPCGLVDALMRSENAAALSAGDRVRLTHGPFADIVATIDRIAPDRRVWLLMDIMGTQTRVSADAGQVRAI